MFPITRAQREALHRKYLQSTPRETLSDADQKAGKQPRTLSYRQFRKTVQMGCDCIMVKWCGMWLGIEKDGYTHS